MAQHAQPVDVVQRDTPGTLHNNALRLNSRVLVLAVRLRPCMRDTAPGQHSPHNVRSTIFSVSLQTRSLFPCGNDRGVDLQSMFMKRAVLPLSSSAVDACTPDLLTAGRHRLMREKICLSGKPMLRERPPFMFPGWTAITSTFPLSRSAQTSVATVLHHTAAWPALTPSYFLVQLRSSKSATSGLSIGSTEALMLTMRGWLLLFSSRGTSSRVRSQAVR
mmetsp:Transcript_4070/g.11570  ORF Transcript_4070/g.11570 Transcript_4070/m.11570 type:complete len:219 (+) Transcript_4070:386-1042(+)